MIHLQVRSFGLLSIGSRSLSSVILIFTTEQSNLTFFLSLSPCSELIRVVEGENDLSRFECQTLAELFKNNVKRYGDRQCLGYREVFGEEDEQQPDGKVFRKLILGDYKWMTYNQVDERVEHLARGLYLQGVKPGDMVMIFADTRAEWLLCAYAVFRIGAHIATLYATLGLDSIVHGINETEVTHIITSHDLLPKFEGVVQDLKQLQTIIYFEGHKKTKSPVLGHCEVIPLSVVEEQGKNSKEKFYFQEKSKDDVAICMFTSGSTDRKSVV